MLVIVFDFTVGNIRSLPLKVLSGSLNAWWVWHIYEFQHFGEISSITADKKLKQMSNGVETIKKNSLAQIPQIKCIAYITLREGLDAAKLFMGVAGNDVRLDITTVNNYFKLLVVMLIPILP